MTDRPPSRPLAANRKGFAIAGAVAVAVAASLVLLFNGWLWPNSVEIVEVELRAPDRLALLVDTCEGNPVLRFMSQSSDDVTVEVSSSTNPFAEPGDCLDVVEVKLSNDLGSRSVVDRHSGHMVDVQVILPSS